MPTKRIFIVDDHPVVRLGYASLIDVEADLEVCGQAGSAEEALQQIPEADPDLVIADLSLGGLSGIELLKRLHARSPELLLLAVSMHDETLYAERALNAGARGYVMKEEMNHVVAAAIRRVLAGGVYLSAAMSDKVLRQYAGHSGHGTQSPIERLADRELETFEHLGRGLTTREIAEAMHISPKTVDTYRSRIKEKLALDTTAELSRRAALWVDRQEG